MKQLLIAFRLLFLVIFHLRRPEAQAAEQLPVMPIGGLGEGQGPRSLTVAASERSERSGWKKVAEHGKKVMDMVKSG